MHPHSKTTRRRYLQGCSVGAAAMVGGCSMLDTRNGSEDVQTAPDGPDSGTDDGVADESGDGGHVFVPDHVHEVVRVGAASRDGLEAALFFSEPDFYWTVAVDGSTDRVEPPADSSMQLLAWVWDREATVVLEDAIVDVALSNDDDIVTETSLVRLLNQRTGMHWAGNVTLERYGTYDVSLTVETAQDRYGQSLSDRVPATATFSFDLEYERGRIEDIRTTYLDQAGERGAVKPMSTDDVPLTVADDPGPDEPGTVLGDARSDGAIERVRKLPASENPLGDDAPYLAVLLRTPFNGYSLPGAELTGTLTAGGETRFDDRLVGTVDGPLGYHYGASVPAVDRGDELTIRIETPPRVARFDGYERAFLECPDRTIELA